MDRYESKETMTKPIIYIAANDYSLAEEREKVTSVCDALDDNPFIERYFTPLYADSFVQGKPTHLLTANQINEYAYLNSMNLDQSDVVIAICAAGVPWEVGFAIAAGKKVILHVHNGKALPAELQVSVREYLDYPDNATDINFIKMMKDD